MSSRQLRQGTRTTAILSIVAITLGVVSMGYACVDLISLPFTDGQIRDNLVDTWEAHTLGNLALFVLFSLAFLGSAIAAWYAGAPNRTRFSFAAAAFLLAATLSVVAMSTLTTRAEKLTGHSLSWF